MKLLSNRKLVSTIGALLLLWLAMLLLGGPGSPADAALLRAFNWPTLFPTARMLTRLGDWDLLLPLTLVTSALLAWLRGVRRAAALLAIGLSGRFLVELEKYEFNRARPDTHGHIVATHNMAFPSGHAAYSMMFWLGLALLALDGEARHRAALFALLMAFAVGLTRPILGVHWPSDVVGGWAFGAAWALLLVHLVIGEKGDRRSAMNGTKDKTRQAAPNDEPAPPDRR